MSDAAAALHPDDAVRGGVGRLLGVHGLLIGCIGVFAGMVAVRLPKEITQDTWLALVAGRQIVQHGLPHHDTLTAWTAGKPWVDQQWLAHLLSYGLYSLGGLVLLAVCQVALVAGSVGAASVFARRSGATARTSAWLLVASIYPVLYAAGGVRTQSFVLPLFVGVVALLVSDVRNPSKRVFLVLPLLALWANLHGSIVVGAGLVVLRGLVDLAGRRMLLRSAALGAGSVLSIFATPYGFGVAGYYRATLVNPAFRNLVSEWGPLTPSLVTALVFVVIGAAVWLLARHPKEVGPFALSAELVLIALSLASVRSIVWFGLASIIVLAPALDAELGRKELAVERLNRLVAIVGIYFVLLVLVVVGVRGSSGLTGSSFPRAAGNAIASAAAARHGTLVYANERFADWILFEHPKLAGHVAYDARFELLSAWQLQRIFDWTNQITPRWQAAVAGTGVVVLDMSDEQPLASALTRNRRFHKLYRDNEIAVFARL